MSRAPNQPAASPAPAVAQLRLLGTTEMECQDRVIRHFGGRSSALLLARLALAPKRRHAREELVDRLWPEADLDAGRNRLRNALSVLRSTLAEAGCDGLVEADRESLRLVPGALSCDVQRFEEAVVRGQWVEARAAYTGELLPGCFDEWVLEERERLAQLAERIPPQLPQLSARHQAALDLADRAALLARRGSPELEERAVLLLDQAVADAPDFAVPHVRLACTLHNIAMRQVGEQRRELVLRARRVMERAIELDPDDAHARAVLLVQRYRRDLDLQQTLAALLDLHQRWPHAVGPLKGLGLVCNDVGRSMEAELHFRRAQALAPMEIIHYYNVGVARLNGYRYAAALEAFDQMLELEPEHGVTLMGRYFALAGLGRLDEALQQAERAGRVGAVREDEMPFYRALCAQWAGRSAEARHQYADPRVDALCAREPAYAVLRDVHLGHVDAAVQRVRWMHDEADPNLLVVFGSRNGLDTRQHPAIEAVARAAGWRPLDQMLAEARRTG